MYAVVELVVAALAGSQLIEYWRHGVLFDPPDRPHATLTALRRLRESPETRWYIRKLAKLLTCPFCLTPWAAGTCWLLLALSRQPGVSPAVALLLRLVPCTMAASRLAQVGHHLLHPFLNSPQIPQDSESPSDGRDMYPWEILHDGETSQSAGKTTDPQNGS